MNSHFLLKISTQFLKFAEEYFQSESGEYRWGRQAAGILILCPEDSTVLLLLRSDQVLEPGTWGIAGGAIAEDEETQDGALREAEEELGSLPKFQKLLNTIVYQENDFSYRTYIYSISLKEKNKWTPQIVLNWENDDFEWFDVDNLPSNLHFGVEYLKQHLF